MSLAESSGPQTRKSTKGSKSSYSLSVAAGQSPGPSPGQGRREERGVERGGGKSHERSLSDTPPVPVGKREGGRGSVLTVFPLPGLTAESSSVAGSVASSYRRGSVSSQESQEDRKGRRLELPPRGGGCPPPPRPPDYQTAVRQRVSRTQSREAGGYSDDETQVSAV